MKNPQKKNWQHNLRQYFITRKKSKSQKRAKKSMPIVITGNGYRTDPLMVHCKAGERVFFRAIFLDLFLIIFVRAF